MRLCQLRMLSTLLIIVLANTMFFAQDLSKDLKTKSISIFKNQSAFVIKEGQVLTDDGNYRAESGIPPALFGTLWFSSNTDNINSVISYQDTLSNEISTKAKSFHDLLRANLDRKVKLYLHNEQEYEGRVEEVNETLVTFKTEDSWISFDANRIRQMEFVDKPELVAINNRKQAAHVLELEFDGNAKKQQLGMMYLQGGIRWSPHYLIELNSDTKASFTLSAEMANDSDDIIDTEINFVVGVPNFKYADKSATLIDFMKTTKPQTNMTFQNVWSADTYEEKIVAVPSSEVDNSDIGSVQEDLFFYTVKNLSLKRGGRGQYKLLSSDINIQHVYECNLSGNSSANKNYTKQFLFTPSTDSKVIHTIRLDNNTNVPWTTGTALVVSNTKDGVKPISQDRLNYTSQKNHSFLKLTEAPDIQVTHKEKLVLREEKFKKIPNQGSKYYYDLVTVEATITIKSFKNKNVDINVRRPLLGQLIETSFPWLTSERVVEHNPLNKTTDVCWETKIGSGEEKEITYRYKLFVRSW